MRVLPAARVIPLSQVGLRDGEVDVPAVLGLELERFQDAHAILDGPRVVLDRHSAHPYSKMPRSSQSLLR